VNDISNLAIRLASIAVVVIICGYLIMLLQSMGGFFIPGSVLSALIALALIVYILKRV